VQENNGGFKPIGVESMEFNNIRIVGRFLMGKLGFRS